jgi:Flp pilus assembly protein TadG
VQWPGWPQRDGELDSQPLGLDIPFWRDRDHHLDDRRGVPMRVSAFRRLHEDDRGAALMMVAILLVVLFGVHVLTIDLGSMVARKRVMVRAADAAALAAAQACAGDGQARNQADAEWFADQLAGENGTGMNLGAQNIVALTECQTGAGR